MQTFSLFVCSGGQSYGIDKLCSSTPVQVLESKAAVTVGRHGDQVLQYSGKVLNSADTLGESGIAKDAIVLLVARGRGGMPTGGELSLQSNRGNGGSRASKPCSPIKNSL